MILDLLTLPLTWLCVFLLGWVIAPRSLSAKHYTGGVLSSLLLLVFCGPTTWLFFMVLGLAIVLLGLVIQRLPPGPLAKTTFAFSVVGTVVLIVVYLRFRVYFQKYFFALPSLSYLGFRGIAYLTSAYRHRCVSFSAGLMQMFFLPMLPMGPISRVENFDKPEQDYQDVLRRLVMGLAMLILGHLCAEFVLSTDVVRQGARCERFWIGALANSFDYYFTFAGYSHLIIGLGLLYGFKLPENFNHPYIATSISDFWRRWHMSLSFWIRDYLYIPLGGSRKGILRKCLNLMAAMTICGVWHGLTLSFLVWGLFHGSLLACESLLAHWGWKPVEKIVPWAYRPAKIAITFSLVTFGWIVFRYQIPDVILYLKGMFPWRF